MEIGLTGHLSLPKLPQERPAPLYHLLGRLGRTLGSGEAVQILAHDPSGYRTIELARLRAVLDCLEFLERYFIGVATGLTRKYDDPAELSSLISGGRTTAGGRRLLRYSLSRLEAHLSQASVRDLYACFFLHAKRSLPFAHARWLGVVGSGSPEVETGAAWSYEDFFASMARSTDYSALGEFVRQLVEILQSWIEGASSFFEGYQHYSRLEQDGWQCTLHKDNLFIELIPPLPTRLIPVEAQVPMAVPQTEDESTLFDTPLRAAAGEALDDAGEQDTPELEQQTGRGDGLVVDNAITLGVGDLSQDRPLEATLSDAGPSLDEGDDVAGERDRDQHGDGSSSRVVDHEVWSASELQSFDNVLREIYPRLNPERIPRDYLGTLHRFIASVGSGYVLVEGRQGSGKTTLAEAFHDDLLGSSLDVVPLIFSVKNQFYPDSTTFLEQLNEHLRLRSESGTRTFEALDPLVIKDLNLRTVVEPGAEVVTMADDLPPQAYRFSSYLSELRLVNGVRLVVILDGLDEGGRSLDPGDSLFHYLPPNLPEGVYVLLTYHPDHLRGGDREALEAIHLGPSTEILLSSDSRSYRELFERCLNRGPEGPLSEALQETLLEKSGGRLAIGQHMLDGLRCQLFEAPDSLPPAEQIYEALFDRLYARVPERYLELFLLLATSDDPVKGDELSYLGISRTDALELIHSLPSLFHASHTQHLGLTLAHQAIRLHLQRTFLMSYASSCQKLAQRALLRLSSFDVAVLPVREDLDRLVGGVRRLLRWAYDSGDIELLAEVSRHEIFGKLRRRMTAAMEERGLHHRKALLLSTFKRGLEKLVLGEGKEEFREELAWALSSRALCYYHLGHYPRALHDVQRAISHFQTMVDDRGDESQRNGLAAAFNRRSEIYLGLRDIPRALAEAEQAVLNYEKVVGSGRVDLSALLMLAYYHRGLVHRALKQFDAAEKDLGLALGGYLRLVDRENRRDLRPRLAAVYQSRAGLALEQGDFDLAQTSITSALELYETLVNQEHTEILRNDLASAYNDRGAILSHLGVFEDAERDYASAIAIRTYLVAEGRIDVRTDLAKTYANRGLCLARENELGAALDSCDRAVEILDRLIEEEHRDDLYAERGFALSCRGELLRQREDLRGAKEDLGSAAGDFRLAVVSQSEEHRLAQAHVLNALAEVALMMGELREARESCESTLQIFARGLPSDGACRREQAIAHHNLGEALRLLGDDTTAEFHFRKAIDLFTFQVEQMGQPELAGELATSLLRLAQVPSQSLEARLRLVSRSLALFSAGEEGPTQPSFYEDRVNEALLLRALICRDMGSLGAAIDDVSRVVGRIEEADVSGAGSQVRSMMQLTALTERASLFALLQDTEAALMDLDRAWDGATLVHLQGYEIEVKRALILLQRAQLGLEFEQVGFGEIVELVRATDQRLEGLLLESLPAIDRRQLRHRLNRVFKALRYTALRPTREGNLEGAIRCLDELLALTSSLGSVSLKLLRQGGGAEAGVDPSAQLQVQRAWVLVKLGRLEEALKDFESVALGLPTIDDPITPDGLELIAEVESGYGAVLDSLGQPERALEAYQRALEAFVRRPESLLSPRRGACLSNRARLLARLERYDDALSDLEPAIEIAASTHHHHELLESYLLKATFLAKAGRDTESLDTLRQATVVGQRLDALDPEHELPMRLGVFRLSPDESERLASLRRALTLFKPCLAGGRKLWVLEAQRLFLDLPLPSSDLRALELEREASVLPELLLAVSTPGHHPLIDALLRRASRLMELSPHAKGWASLGAAYYSLATKFCLLEYQKYGVSSLPRLVRCYVLVARSLVDADPPRQIQGLGVGIAEIAKSIFADPPTGELEVEVNNLARLWLSLPPSRPLQAGMSRLTLQKLRRW